MDAVSHRSARGSPGALWRCNQRCCHVCVPRARHECWCVSNTTRLRGRHVQPDDHRAGISRKTGDRQTVRKKGTQKGQKAQRYRRHFAFLVPFVFLPILLLRITPHPKLSDQIPLSTGVWSADGELLRVTLASDDQYRLWTPLSEMSPELIDAFLLKEDRYFRWHPGVNPVALIRASFKTYNGGQRQGGSTLTMQLARMMYHLNTRSVWGKLRQAGSALWLERRYSKRELLEA